MHKVFENEDYLYFLQIHYFPLSLMYSILITSLEFEQSLKGKQSLHILNVYII